MTSKNPDRDQIEKGFPLGKGFHTLAHNALCPAYIFLKGTLYVINTKGISLTATHFRVCFLFFVKVKIIELLFFLVVL